MRRPNKSVPFVLILAVFMFLPGCIGQEEMRIPYDGADVLIQTGNSQPKFQLDPSSVNQVVPDIRLGACFYSSNTVNDLPYLDTWMPNIIDLGIWRFDTCVGQVEEPIIWEDNWEEDIPEAYDQFIDELNGNGVTVDYMLHFWDKAGHANGSELSTPRFQSEEQIQDFLNYTRFVVSHYKGRVQYYTIWSEPDNCGGAGGEEGIKCILPEDYINLVRRTVPVIHEEDPQVKVAIAPNVLFFAQDYLSSVIESDIMTMVDVVQWHGIYNVLPDDPFYGDYYYDYPAIIEGIRQTATAHGFDGEFWATEISYGAGGNPPGQPWGYPQTGKQAAKYSSRSVVTHLGMNMGISMGALRYDNPTIAPWSQRAIGNLYKVLAGTEPISLVVKFEDEPINAVTNGFALSNGDMLFALWTDGEAVYDDPGVRTTLTVPGLSAQKVVAIDVLNGFEQELIRGVESGNLVIPNIFVMDYPIILRINNDTSTIPPQGQFSLMQLSIVIGVPVVVAGVLVLWEKRKGASWIANMTSEIFGPDYPPYKQEK